MDGPGDSVQHKHNNYLSPTLTDEMNYGSELVYMYSESDEEYVSDTELQEGMWLR